MAQYGPNWPKLALNILNICKQCSEKVKVSPISLSTKNFKIWLFSGHFYILKIAKKQTIRDLFLCNARLDSQSVLERKLAKDSESSIFLHGFRPCMFLTLSNIQ